MPGTSCLYRRPSGIYAVRLVVPKRLRDLVGRTEIHTSTGLRSLDAAKTAALKIQLHWRERFLAMDTEKLRNESPLLAGGGMISVTEAADAIGLSPSALAGELLNDRAELYAHVNARRCWKVTNLGDIDRDYDGAFIRNDAESKGTQTMYSGIVRFFDSTAALGQFAIGANLRETIFREGEQGAIFLEMNDPLEVTLSQCIVSKPAIARIRACLASSLGPGPVSPPVAVSVATAGAEAAQPILDPRTAKHGQKRFSHLFDLLRRDRKWSADTGKRNATEAGLFVDLMDDPALGDIEKETVLEFARRLALLPSDIYQARRKYGVTSLAELIDIAERDGLKRKTEATVKRHIGHLSEVLGYGVKAGMMWFNPAADYKRGWGDMKRAQDERDAFTPDEISLIFSQDWFTTGAGLIDQSGRTHWRPHYYWLPLLGLLTGGRINELSQLYLDDIRKTESGVWYLDFNLNEPDKSDADENDGPDKSLKTVNAIRVVPMHGELVRLGLPEYVAALRKAGHTRLFPELKRDPIKGYGKPAGSWFNERFLGRKLGIERNGKKTFHSLRHCFVTAAERLGLPERVLAQLAGHERGNTQSGTRYAKDRGADELAPNLAALNFPQLAAVAPFKIADALRAIKRAERLKGSAAKRHISSDGR